MFKFRFHYCCCGFKQSFLNQLGERVSAYMCLLFAYLRSCNLLIFCFVLVFVVLFFANTVAIVVVVDFFYILSKEVSQFVLDVNILFVVAIVVNVG